MTEYALKNTIPDSWRIHPLIDDRPDIRTSCFSYLEHSITSKDTRQTYRRALTRLMAHCHEIGVEDLLDIEPSHIKEAQWQQSCPFWQNKRTLNEHMKN